MGARILAVADTFDAITSTRPYRRSNPHRKALEILAAEAGTQLDPDAVHAFRACYSGRKPLAFWAVLVNSRPRVEYLLGQGWAPASAPSVFSTAATAAAVGAVAIGPAATALPDSPHAVRANTAVNASTGPLSQGMAPRTTTLASFVGEPYALGASGRSKPSVVSGASGPSGRDPAAAGGSGPGSNGDSAPTDSRRLAAGDVPSGADEAAGGPDGGVRDHGSNGNGRSGKGNGHGNANENTGSNGNSTSQGYANNNGRGTGNAQGQGNANGQAPGNTSGLGLGNANGQGQGNANGHANAIGQGMDSGPVTGPGQGGGQGNGSGHAKLEKVTSP